MSKTKQRERSELEHLRGEIRQLQSVNRSLRQRIRQLSKKEHIFDDSDINERDDDDDMDLSDLQKNLCPRCKQGVLHELDLIYVVLKKCNNCTYNEKHRPTDGKKEEKEKP